MARFSVRVHTRQGVQTAEVEAFDARQAEIRAGVKGTVVGVKRIRSMHTGALSYSDRQVFLSRLASMLASKVSATQALELMRDTFRGRIRQVSHALLLKVESGMSVPEAIVAQGGRDFPPTTAAMIKSGAQSGATAQALRDAMEFEQHLRHIKKQSAKGVLPALVAFIVAIAFVVGTVFFMVPSIMDSALMKMTGAADNFQETVTYGYMLGYVMASLLGLMIALGLLATIGRKVSPRAADAIILRIPIYKDLVLSKGHYVAFYGLSILVRTGVRMEQALELLADTTRAGALREDFKRARDAVKNGRPWAPAMKTLQPTDRAALGASMNRADVGQAMDAIALAYRDLYAQRVAALTPVLQIMAALGLVLSGLVMFGLTILPVLKMSTKMLG